MIDLLDAIIEYGQGLFKLKLSQSFLADQAMIDRLVEIHKLNTFLTHLDLSWSGMKASMMKTLATSLNDRIDKSPMRNLNLSHNLLCIDESNAKDFEDSMNFIKLMVTYIEDS